MGNFLLLLWAVIIAFAVYGFGISGVAATLLPTPFTAETALSAIPAWLIMLGIPALAIWLKSRNADTA